jgi:hypothetical protein
MLRAVSPALAIVATAMIAMSPAAPLLAKSAASMSTATPPAPARAYVPPSVPYPYYPYPGLKRKDDRTPRQRCFDDETARLGSRVSDLDRRGIDLKCSRH